MEERVAKDAKEEPHPARRGGDNRREAQLAYRLQYLKTVRRSREMPASNEE